MTKNLIEKKIFSIKKNKGLKTLRFRVEYFIVNTFFMVIIRCIQINNFALLN